MTSSPEDRGYDGPGGYRPREDRLMPLNGMCGEDTASYPECRMSCYIGDEAECDDAKMNTHGQRISCKACKRVTLVGTQNQDGKLYPNLRSGSVLYGNKLIWYNCSIFKLSTIIIICFPVVRIGMPRTPRLCAENWDSIQITNFPKQCMVNSRV